MQKKGPQLNKPSDAEQSTRFIETARALGADESEESFRAALKKVARHKPSTNPEVRPEGGPRAKPR